MNEDHCYRFRDPSVCTVIYWYLLPEDGWVHYSYSIQPIEWAG